MLGIREYVSTILIHNTYSAQPFPFASCIFFFLSYRVLVLTIRLEFLSMRRVCERYLLDQKEGTNKQSALVAQNSVEKVKRTMPRQYG